MSDLEQKKQDLYNKLHAAIELELSTIPPYMTALISIKPGTNRVAANNIRGVMMEEMLHITLAGNLLSSINGRMTFGQDNIPEYPLTLKFEETQFKNREFDVDLARFSETTIDTFCKIELPEHWDSPVQKMAAVPEIDVPAYTIGEFYDEISAELSQLCDEYGETAVFNGDPARQININYYWAGGGQPVIVTNLQQAQEAINVIVTQGEGVPGSVYDGDKKYFDQHEDIAHFFRFTEILYGRFYQSGDDPKQPPTGDEFEVNYDDVYPIIKNAKTKDYQGDPKMAGLNLEFNQYYSAMLYQIAEAFNGSPGALYTAILNGMHDMSAIALEMVQTPIAGNVDGLHGAPSFEWVQPHE